MTFAPIFLLLSACMHPASEGNPPPPPSSIPALPGPMPFSAYVPGGPVTTDADDAVVGLRSAPMAILEWSDIQCPYCSVAFAPLAAYVASHADVRLIYKHYPLSSLCNPEIEGVRHEYACSAARATVCADQRGQAEAMLSILFANQSTLTDPDIVRLARAAHVYNKAFETCLESPLTDAKLARDIQQGVAAHVEGTPTFFVYGPWGPRWVRVGGGPGGVITVIEAARKGTPLPEPLLEPRG